MASFGDIVAYSYKADLYGPECIMAQVIGLTVDHAADSAERDLDVLALSIGIDRNNESSFDSDEFPKVVLFDHLHDNNYTYHCGSCGKELL